MTYRIEPTSPMGRELQRIVATQIADAARQFAAIRDAQVILPTIELLAPTESARGLRHEQADSAAQAIAALVTDDAPIRRARKRIAKAERLAFRWDIDDRFASFEEGLSITYRGGRRGLRAATANTTDEAIHEWRKRVKDLWYQLRLLEQIAPSTLTPLIAQLDDLGESLGVDHDLAVAATHLDAEGIADARALQRASRDWTLRIGATIYAEPSKAFVGRLRRYFALTRERGPEIEI